jgi:hypothetical protein
LSSPAVLVSKFNVCAVATHEDVKPELADVNMPLSRLTLVQLTAAIRTCTGTAGPSRYGKLIDMIARLLMETMLQPVITRETISNRRVRRRATLCLARSASRLLRFPPD